MSGVEKDTQVLYDLRTGAATDNRSRSHSATSYSYSSSKLELYAALPTLPISPNKTGKIIKAKTGFSFSSL